MATTQPTQDRSGRFEFRVWGHHRAAARKLAELADRMTEERIDDCYLLTPDPNWNAKIRGDAVKLKQLVEERKGFEQWVSERHRSAESAPSPFDDLFEELRLDRNLGKGPADFERIVERIAPDSGLRAVAVRKDRRRYWVGDLRGETTRIRLRTSGETLRTLVIEGADLSALSTLRKRLGLRGASNVAVHHALAAELDR